jgi:hypothetical protein
VANHGNAQALLHSRSHQPGLAVLEGSISKVEGKESGDVVVGFFCCADIASSYQ